VVVPLVVELVSPRSVVDVGCGSGVWLQAFRDAGIDDVCGIDGPWVEPSRLLFPSEAFRAHDLTQPIHFERRYDLAVSLEVGEHLPPDAAAGLVASLTRAAPIVLFSAAIPGQRGAEHINEQWPDYWVELFARVGYVAVDAVRAEIWDDPNVAPCYAQNTAIYCEAAALSANPKLRAAYTRAGERFPALVHPRLFEGTVARADDLTGLLRERLKDALGPARPLARRAKRALARR
jgi:SAM-dependent methyltransferase